MLEDGILLVRVEPCDFLVLFRSELFDGVISHLVIEFDFIDDVLHVLLFMWGEIFVQVLIF